MSYTIKTEKKPEASKHEFKVKDFVKMNRDDSVCMIIDPEQGQRALGVSSNKAIYLLNFEDGRIYWEDEVNLRKSYKVVIPKDNTLTFVEA